MNPLLDPRAAAEAGAPHGQLVSALTGGGLVLTCHKVIDDDARALILLAPGLFRMDVRSHDDSLEVMSRALHAVPARWGTHESPAGASPAADGYQAGRMAWTVVIDLRPEPITASIELRMTSDRATRTAHFAAHAVIRERGVEAFAVGG